MRPIAEPAAHFFAHLFAFLRRGLFPTLRHHVLAEMPALEDLSLQEARLTLGALSQLKKLPNLKRLTLDGIDIPEADIATLKQQLPKTDVRWTPPNESNKKRIEALFK